jgi:acetylornithine/succinyldiaminopimelate/putrescine aminotransferase
MEKAFFCNSGAEANEAAIKIARKWAKKHKGPDCHEIVTFTGSFHGRTLATVTATAQPKYQESFKPLPPGFKYVELGNLHALDEAISDRTCAVMIEPIQGESGINIPSPEFLAAVQALCQESGVLLILDEVQSGLGRTGCFLASHQTGTRGDIVTLAKGIANGVPMGVCLARGEAAATLVPGDHGSTFGGQPLACAAALAVLDVLEDDNLLENASQMGAYFLGGLKKLQARFPNRIKEARGVGLLVALEFSEPCAKTVLHNLLERGVVVNAVGDTILRFLPPLTVTAEECDRVVRELEGALAA